MGRKSLNLTQVGKERRYSQGEEADSIVAHSDTHAAVAMFRILCLQLLFSCLTLVALLCFMHTQSCIVTGLNNLESKQLTRRPGHQVKSFKLEISNSHEPDKSS
jgi:hypothetical protein